MTYTRLSDILTWRRSLPPRPLRSYTSDMDVTKMIDELRQERDQLGEAIITLERLAAGHGKRRGRPPAWMTAVKKRRGRPPGSKNRTKAA